MYVLRPWDNIIGVDPMVQRFVFMFSVGSNDFIGDRRNHV
jgi:hypothetical protein